MYDELTLDIPYGYEAELERYLDDCEARAELNELYGDFAE